MNTTTDVHRVFICDDQFWLRQALTDVIAEIDGFDKVGEASGGTDCLAQLAESRADILILDVSMPQGGADLVRAAKHLLPTAKIIIYTAHRSQRLEDELRAAGADDYLVKTGRLRPLRDALHRAVADRN